MLFYSDRWLLLVFSGESVEITEVEELLVRGPIGVNSECLEGSLPEAYLQQVTYKVAIKYP